MAGLEEEDAVRAKGMMKGMKEKGAALGSNGGLTTVRYHGLDVGEEESVWGFRGFLEREHSQGVDVVVNNAGVAMEGFGMLWCFGFCDGFVLFGLGCIMHTACPCSTLSFHLLTSPPCPPNPVQNPLN